MTARSDSRPSSLHRTIALGAAALGTAAALAFPVASASAAPEDPAPRVPGTTCTTDQLERAVRATSPEVAGYLDNPRVRATFERVALLPEPARSAQISALVAEEPRVKVVYDRFRPLIDQRIAIALGSCARF
ncbi:hemophore-related protein [Williamsia deligens]|uniref:Hemophore-related protein n=1 Tax=Williamsia deligens TaxID=321325 RepID=A0ABW3GBQ8_9NOCA|nr:hemophore-related protein [Williamsia deligens]MCP2192795.1 hemophore-related protein, Rv0203/Rv1174c family [Williamsia deligens]